MYYSVVIIIIPAELRRWGAEVQVMMKEKRGIVDDIRWKKIVIKICKWKKQVSLFGLLWLDCILSRFCSYHQFIARRRVERIFTTSRVTKLYSWGSGDLNDFRTNNLPTWAYIHICMYIYIIGKGRGKQQLRSIQHNSAVSSSSQRVI